MLKKVLAVLAGIAAAVGVFMAFEFIGGKLYPLPVGIDKANHEAMEKFMSSLPASALLIVLAGWVVGSFICGLIVRLVSRSSDKTPSYIAGLFLLTAGIVDMFMYPHPVWFIITGIIIFIPFTLLGHTILKRPSKPETQEPLRS